MGRFVFAVQKYYFFASDPLVTFVSLIKQTFCLLSVSASCSHKQLGPLPTGVYLGGSVV